MPESAAGKKAQCPVCATISPVPVYMGPVTALPAPTAGGPAHGFGDASYSGTSSNPASPSGVTFLDGPNGTPASENPYASPAYVPDSLPVTSSSQQVGINDVWEHGYAVFSNNIGIAIFAVVVSMGLIVTLLLGSNFFLMWMRFAPPESRFAAAASLLLLNFGTQTFLGIGMARLYLKLARHHTGAISDLFEGGDAFFPVCGFLFFFTVAWVLGLALLIVPGLLLLLNCWAGYLFILDNKTTMFDSFAASAKASEGNIFTIILLGLLSLLLVAIGLIACVLGVFVTIPLVQILWTTAYLMMSGQIPARRQAYPTPHPTHYSSR